MHKYIYMSKYSSITINNLLFRKQIDLIHIILHLIEMHLNTKLTDQSRWSSVLFFIQYYHRPHHSMSSVVVY